MPLQPEHERCRAKDHAQPSRRALLHFLMSNVLPAELTELVPLQAIRIVLFVLAGRIISLLADRTGQVDDISHLPSPEPSALSHQP
jgi:hypothetical protein